MKNNIIINLINSNQGAHLIRSKNFLLNLLKLDKVNNYIILTEKNLNVKNKNFVYIKFDISKNKLLSFIQRFVIQNIIINYLFFKYDIKIYINFSHTIPFISLRKIFKIIAVTNVAPFIKFNKYNKLQKLKMFFLRYKILYSCLFSDKIISISYYCKKLLKKNNIYGKKIVVIPNGITKKIEIKNNKKILNNYFLYVSHFYKYKNFENLITSYSMLPKKISKKFKLIIIGNPYDNEYFYKIKKQIKKLKLLNNIKIYSNLSRDVIDKYIQNCYLFVFPSLIENCPMSLLEAMQYDRPILSSKIPPMNEFCNDLPIYFDPRKPNSIANSIIEFCDNNVIMGNSYNYTKIKKKLTWENFTKRILNMYLI